MSEDEQINKEEEVVQEKSELNTLADLFRDDEAEKPEEQAEKSTGEAAEKQTKAKPKTLKDLTEKLKLDDKDLYAIEVPFANGESRTLGELKDLVSKQDDFTVRELEFEETFAEREQDLVKQQRAVFDIAKRMGVTQELLDDALQRDEQYRRSEWNAALQAVPDWQDKETRDKEFVAMANYLEGYGFDKNYLERLAYDHRMMRFVRDSLKRKERMEAALAAVKTKRTNSTTSKPTSKAPRKSESQPPRKEVRPNAGLRELFAGEK